VSTSPGTRRDGVAFLSRSSESAACGEIEIGDHRTRALSVHESTHQLNNAISCTDRRDARFDQH
jgi:hypothetical protein